MQVTDLFKPFVDPTLPAVPASFPECCHDRVREVMKEWKDRRYTTDELIEEVVTRGERIQHRMQPAPELTD